jgi:hypothetical protein
MIEQAFRLEYMTLAWMLVQAAVAIGSGIAAGSLILMAFGIDSLIELASACVLIWRLTVELKHGQAFAEDAERKAARIGGALLFALATYVIVSAGWKLWTGQGAELSLPGLTVTILAMPIMYFLSRRKLQVAPMQSAAGPFGQMRSRASPVAGSPSSLWARSSPNSLLALGGLTQSPQLALSGSWSAKDERHGKATNVVAQTEEARNIRATSAHSQRR